jgi:predicted nucleic acid-binding Zn ribbon protein
MTVARTTPAPMLCFGQESMDGTPKFSSLASPDKKAPKKKRQELQKKAPAQVAPTLPEPRGGVATPGSGEADVPAVAAASPADVQRQQPAEQQLTGSKDTKSRDKKDKKVGTGLMDIACTSCVRYH